MACPDQDAIAHLKSLDGDPDAIRHLKDCPSRWRDWLVLQAARRALYPPGEVRRDLNERAMARIIRKAQQLEKPTSRRELAVSGILVAAATAALLLTAPSFAAPVVTTVICSLATGVATMLVLRKQDGNRQTIGNAPTSTN